ncbi:hypothetical protein D3C74_489840 [compost metagenome]
MLCRRPVAPAADEQAHYAEAEGSDEGKEYTGLIHALRPEVLVQPSTQHTAKNA